MKQKVFLAIFAAIPILALAHNGVEHLLGTVKAVNAESITVETVTHQTTTILLDPATTYTNQGAKAALKDLKPGQRVALDARENPADKKLHVIAVRWGTSKPQPSVR